MNDFFIAFMRLHSQFYQLYIQNIEFILELQKKVNTERCKIYKKLFLK